MSTGQQTTGRNGIITGDLIRRQDAGTIGTIPKAVQRKGVIGMYTQIYSIQTKEEALACIDAGADRIGLLVGVHGGKFPCAIT